jgi:hypothetical protein
MGSEGNEHRSSPPPHPLNLCHGRASAYLCVRRLRTEFGT